MVKLGVRKSSIHATKREAQDWANKVEAEIAAGTHKKSDKTFKDLCVRYTKDVTPTKAGAKWEQRRIEGFLAHFGEVPLSEIDAPHIAGWRDARLREVTASTVVREANILKNMFRLAINEWGWIERSPFVGVKLPKENPPRSTKWTWQLIKRVLRAGARSGPKTQEVVQAFHIALRTGMRLQEVLQAPLSLDKKRRVVVVKSKTAPHGETIPLTRHGFRLLEHQKPFTVNANEGSVLFSKLCRQQLIEGLTFHDARATALTFLSRKVDVLTLSRISRHKDLGILQRVYYRETPEEVSQRLLTET